MASHPAGSAATSPAATAPNSSDPQRRSLSPMESPKALSWAQSSSSSSSMTLPASFPHGRLASYADDTQILDSAPSKHSDIQVMNFRAEENSKCLQHWFSLNSLKMNADKTCFTLLGTKHSVEKASDFVLQVNDVDIQPTKHIKVLVLLDQTLSWEPHMIETSNPRILFVSLGWCSQCPPGPTAEGGTFRGAVGLRPPQV